MDKNYLFLFLAGLGFLLAASPGQSRTAISSPVSVRVISDSGRDFKQFQQPSRKKQSRAYLLAKKGQRYQIELQNNTARRVGVVVAVDGRNVIDGSYSNLTRNERMIILKPYQISTLKGWQTSRNRANRFYFTHAENSYAAAWNDFSATGVIASAVFFEKPHENLAVNPPTKRFFKRSSPGTGFGNSVRSPTEKVHFMPAKKCVHTNLIKYEWRKNLIRLGIIKPKPKYRGYRNLNRFWSYQDHGFAPYPPGRRYRY